MEKSAYDLAAIRIIAKHLEEEAPFNTVSKVLAHDGWIDLVETIHTCYPYAFLWMCGKHQAEIETALKTEGVDA